MAIHRDGREPAKVVAKEGGCNLVAENLAQRGRRPLLWPGGAPLQRTPPVRYSTLLFHKEFVVAWSKAIERTSA